MIITMISNIIIMITILTMNHRAGGRDMFVEAAIMGPMFKLLLGRLPTLHRSTCHVIIYELAKAREKWPQLRQHL